MLRTYRLAAGAVAFFLAACLVVGAQEPKKDGPGDKGGDPKGEGKGGRGKGGFGGPGGGGFQRPKPGTVLPVFFQDQLKLTEDQKKEVADLQKMVDEKLGKILTDEQKKQLKEMSERGPGGPGGPGGGFGRPGGGRPGGPGGDGPPPKKDN
jgi:Spy/CpxP family protein refolding chaperone